MDKLGFLAVAHSAEAQALICFVFELVAIACEFKCVFSKITRVHRRELCNPSELMFSLKRKID